MFGKNQKFKQGRRLKHLTLAGLLLASLSTGCSKSSDDAADASAAASGNTSGTSSSTTSSIVTLAGVLSLTSSSSSALRLAADPYYVKCVTNDLSPTACIDQVDDTTGAFELECDSFRNKKFSCFILTGSDPNDLEVVGVISSKDLVVGDKTTRGVLNIKFDPSTGAASFESFDQVSVGSDGSETEVAPVAISISDELKAIDIADGNVEFQFCDLEDKAEQKQVRNGDLKSVPGEGDLDTKCMRKEGRYLDFTAATDSEMPTLALWRSESAVSSCADGYHISDGTNSLTAATDADLTYKIVLDKIIANKWAPQAALDRYYVSAHGESEDDQGVSQMMEVFNVSDKDALATKLVEMLEKAYTGATLTKGRCENVKYSTGSAEFDESLNKDGPPPEWCVQFKSAKTADAITKVKDVWLADIKGHVLNDSGPQLQAGRGLVEGFLNQMSEARHRNNPDDRYADLEKNLAELPANVSEASDAVVKALAKTWAEVSYNDEFRKTMNLALKNYTTVDNIKLGGTGKSYILTKLSKLAELNKIAGEFSGLGWDHQGLKALQLKEFAQAWKAKTSDTTLASTLETAITKLSSTSTEETGRQEVLNQLHSLQDASDLTRKACEGKWEIDFSPIFNNSTAVTAFDTFISKINLPSNQNQFQAGKKNASDSSKTIVLNFINGISPYLAGCSRWNMLQNISRINSSTYWENGEQKPIPAEDQDRNADDTLRNFGFTVQQAYLSKLIFGINIKDPNADGNSLINTDGSQNSNYTSAQAELDYTSLSNSMKDLLTKFDNYSYLCHDLKSAGVEVSDISNCNNQGGGNQGSGNSNANIFGKLFQLQDRMSEIVSRESFRTDPTYRKTLAAIQGSSNCIFDASVSHQPVTDGDDLTFKLQVRGPVDRFFSADLDIDPLTSKYFVDGSRLQFEESMGGSCYWGDVQKLTALTVTEGELASGVMQQGWINTCGGGNSSEGSSEESGSAHTTMSYFKATYK